MTILDKILVKKRQEIVAAQAARPEKTLRTEAEKLPPPRDFFAAIAAPGPIKLIAEVKKASPSKGIIRPDFDPVTIAETYAAHGATCLSVLTDEAYFQGHLDFLAAVRAAVALPVLRKDFIIDPYQVWEARAAGADAVLLIAECLDQPRLCELHELATRLGMTALVEIYDPENLTRVVDAGARLIGVNNRDLRTFEVDLAQTLRILPQVPQGCLLVSESGISQHAEVAQLRAAGVAAILVGETLMRQADVGRAVDELLGRITPR